MTKSEGDVTQQVSISAVDGYLLSGRVYRGGDHVVVINAATATPQRFYRAFATFLVAQGYTVVTFDYRGIAESAPPSLRGFEGRMSDWALLDMQGVLTWVSAELTPAKLIVMGHSIGGQAMGLLPDGSTVDAMITFSAQSGYWGLQGEGEVAKTWFYAHFLMPLLAQLVGYFPWSKLGTAEDLPKGVALQWSKWCRDPRYLMSDMSLPIDRYEQFTAPVLALSVDDDVWGTARSVDAMMQAYPNLERRHIVPRVYGIERLGHFGLFRPKSEPIWHELVTWLKEQVHTPTTDLQGA